MIFRPELIKQVQEGLHSSPVTALLGPRQCGKTTLARTIAASEHGTYLDLENPRDLKSIRAGTDCFGSIAGFGGAG